jgi:DNA-binding Xre family transcriptional regulator
MNGSDLIIKSLRALLRERGMTYRGLAAELGISEPTVKRDLSRGGFSLHRLDRICEVLDVSLEDLLLGRHAQTAALTQLSDAQERALVREPTLLVLTYLLVNDWRLSEIGATFALDENALLRSLSRLDVLRIIEFRPPKRIKKLTARNFAWRSDGPVHDFFVTRVAPEFLRGRFDAGADQLHFLGGLLSTTSAARIKAAIGRLVEEFDKTARQDAHLGIDSRDGYSVLLALRKWEYSAFTRLRRRSS